VNWGPLQPARIDFSDAGAPIATDFGAAYPAGASAAARARQVFLAGNQLPARWAGRTRFVVLEAGFGLGHNFLATWQAWQADPQRSATLHYLAIEQHPPRLDDLARAHAATPWPAGARALQAAWPPLTPDLHPIALDGGRVQLLLAFGDIAQVLPELVAQVDAFYLDGFDPAHHPAMWDPYRLRALARLAAPGATLAASSASGAVRAALRSAGFVPRAAPEAPAPPPAGPDDRAGPPTPWPMTAADHRPAVRPPVPPGRQARPQARRVAVVGAGLAGAAVAQALAAQGCAVQVFDRQPGCAGETSGNAGGLFHGIVHAHDGPHARWLRAAAVHSARVLGPLLAGGRVDGALAGLLRGEQALDAPAMQALLDRLALPPDYVQTATLPTGAPAWCYPGGGWLAPATLCAHWLAAPGVTTRYATTIDRLQPAGDGWQLLGADGRCLAEADAVLLCNAADAARLAASAGAGGPAWPLQRVRGQTTLVPAQPGLPRLPQPLADTGYVLQLHDGRLLCGASSQLDDDDPTLRPDEHARHLATLRRLTGWVGTPDPQTLGGRVGWRVRSDDRLPLLGPVPAPAPVPLPGGPHGARARRLDQPRLVPRLPGLYVFTALGSRGITQAALGGAVLAAWLTGAPVPLPASLMDALDPARFLARAVRRAG